MTPAEKAEKAAWATPYRGTPSGRKDWRATMDEIRQTFAADLAAPTEGLPPARRPEPTRLPEDVASALFEYAWREGHGEGYRRVEEIYREVEEIARAAWSAGFDDGRD